MTTQQLHLFNGMCLVVFIVVAIITRATKRRIAGAVVGAAVGGVVALGIIALGEEVGWWHVAMLNATISVYCLLPLGVAVNFAFMSDATQIQATHTPPSSKQERSNQWPRTIPPKPWRTILWTHNC